MTEYVSGNIYIREGSLNKGEVVDGHSHSFDHTTYCPSGSMLIEALDKKGKATRSITLTATEGKNWALIKAGTIHRLTGLEDNTMYHCIFSHRSPNPDNDHVVVQEYEGFHEANT